MMLNIMSNFTDRHRQDMVFNMRGIDQLLDGYKQFEKHKTLVTKRWYSKLLGCKKIMIK